MHGTAAQQRHDRIAGLLEPQASGHHSRMILRHRNAAVVPEKIRRLEQVDMQRMAFDPLATIEQPAQVTQCTIDMQTEHLLDRMDRAHLIRHGANTANPRDDVRHFAVMPSLQEGLEKPGWLEDSEFYVLDGAVFHGDTERAFTLHACHQVDGNGSRVPRLFFARHPLLLTHYPLFSQTVLSFRKGSTAPLIPRNRRRTSTGISCNSS